MPSTHLSLHFHAVFSTKERLPTIDPAWMPRLHDYLGGTIKGLGGFSDRVGGVTDHIHLLFDLKATHCLSDFMRDLKKASSRWVHDTIGLKSFEWQEGYGAFTIGATSRPGVRRYIENQAEHHHLKSYREELIEMLEKAEVQYDPKYLD